MIAETTNSFPVLKLDEWEENIQKNFLDEQARHPAYDILLKILGLWSLNPSNETGNCQFEKNAFSCKSFANILYIIFVFAMIGWKPLYEIINFLGFSHISMVMFSFIVPIMFAVELIYFRTTHFKDTLYLHREYEYLLNRNSVCIILVSFLMAIVSALIYSLSPYLLEVYINIRPTNQVLYGFVCFFEHFYSYTIFFSSVLTFNTVFTIHSMVIKDFSDYVAELEYEVGSINNIFNKFVELKKSYEESVSKLNTMFSVTTFLGFLATYSTISNFKKIPDYYLELVYIIIYILAEIVYFYSINIVRNSIGSIRSTIFSGGFTKKYLTRQPFLVIETNLPGPSPKDEAVVIDFLPQSSPSTKTNEVINRLYRKTEHINKNIRDSLTTGDWIIMSTLMSTRWKEIELLGFDTEGLSLLKKVAGVVATYIVVEQFGVYY